MIKVFMLVIIIILLSSNICFADVFQDGINAYSQKNYTKAEICFKNALSSSPNNVSVRYYLAITLVKNNKLQDAQKEYLYIINAAPNSEAAYRSTQGLSMLTSATYSPSKSSNISKITLDIDANKPALIVKNVVINNQASANFVLDSGATYTLISSALAEKLRLNTNNSSRIQLMTANGLITAPKIMLKSIEINGLIARDVEVVVHDLDGGKEFSEFSGISGLLGLSFMQKFKVTIDKLNGKLTLEKTY
ncbi:MAG: retroviral-like aspartic protease family protein [bacterium]